MWQTSDSLCCQKKIVEFCKVLIEAYPESLRIGTNNGSLPVHEAYMFGYTSIDPVGTIEFMLNLYPESITARNEDGYLPIHCAVTFEATPASVEILLKHDPDAASKNTTDADRCLPLHLACKRSRRLDVVQVSSIRCTSTCCFTS